MPRTRVIISRLQENTLQLKSFAYHPTLGWSIPEFPDLDSSETLVFASGSPVFGSNTLPLDELRSAFPSSHILGGSSAGDIMNTQVLDGGLAVTVVQFSHTPLKSATVPIRGTDKSYDAGCRIANRLEADDLVAVLVVADGRNVNGSEFARGLNSVLDDHIVVAGVMACDGADGDAWVLKSGSPQPSLVSAVGLYGNRVDVSSGRGEGWTVFGPTRTITRADGNTLYELDEQPVLDIISRYLGDYASELPAAAHHFPVAIEERNELTQVEIIRSAIDVDFEARSLSFTGNVPLGATVQLARPNIERLVSGATDAATEALMGCDDMSPVFAFAISHVGRRLTLGSRTEEELEAMRKPMPAGAIQAGMYGLGEFAPNETGQCGLFNLTITLTTIQEAA